MDSDKLQRAYQAIDEYNMRDPNTEPHNGSQVAKEVLYGQRMTLKLEEYEPNASEHLKLAARAQHIGRWEIPRDSYPMDRKGYLQWRSAEKIHHTKVIDPILKDIGYGRETIDRVKFLLLKKELGSNQETQVLEDVVCLVFIQHYLEEFANQHDDDKIAEILRKTMKKMSPRCIAETANVKVSERIQGLLLKAVGGN